MKNKSGLSDLLFIVIIIFLALASVGSYLRLNNQNVASNLVVHTSLVKYKLGQILNFIREAETREQSSVHATDSVFNYVLGHDSVTAYAKLYDLDSITREDHDKIKLQQLYVLMNNWLVNLHDEHEKAVKISADLSQNVLQGQTVLNRIQLLAIELRHAEDELLLEKIQEKDRAAFLSPFYSLILSFLAILFITAAYFRLRNETLLRMKAEDGQAIIHNFFQQAPAMMAILKGPEHIFEFVNPSYQELIGGRNPINQPVREAIPEVAGQGYYELLDSVYKTGKPFIGEEMPLEVNRGKGVDKLFINFIYQALKNTAGETEGILVFCYDVSELVLARNKLQEAENRTRLAIEAAKMGTFDWNLQNHQFISSERLFEIFGYQHTENFTHEDLLKRMLPEDKKARDRALDASFSSGFLSYEARILWPDESLHWVRVYGKILSDDARNILRMYGTVVDITSEKHFVQELEKNVLERTQSLNDANFTLKQTVSELEQSNAELASFNYIASHDLQEPLRKIIAFSKRIEDLEKDLSDSSRDYFGRIIHAASRMQNLIDAFLSYSQTTNSDASLEPSDLNSIFAEVKSDFSDSIEQKNARVESAMLPEVMGIPLQLNQMFTNLIGNAIKYSRVGIPPEIKVTAEQIAGSELTFEGVDNGLVYWKINVGDNGIGFDQIHENQIFELFQRLHNKQAYAGTGIGLAICKKIMRNHKGFIAATGKSESGATFSMYFPVLSARLEQQN